MTQETVAVLAEMNRAIIQFRGVYSVWSKKHGISYNEMLVLYTIREHGFCTQKQICDSYLLPRQTMNHVILDMRKRGLLVYSPAHCVGREKAFVLSEQGRVYAQPLMDSLERIEECAVEQMGAENIRVMTEHMLKYSAVLSQIVDDI